MLKCDIDMHTLYSFIFLGYLFFKQNEKCFFQKEEFKMVSSLL